MKKLNVGIVGYGWAAGAHIAAIQSSALGQVTAVCSSRALDSREVTARHGCPIQVYTDLNAMLSDKTLDVVSICSYHAQHKEHTLAAVLAGKHVIVEKPLALNFADVREIESAVRKAGVNFCVCFELRFSSQFRAIRSVLDRGLLGSLHYAEVDYYHGIGPWYREFEWCTTNEACGSSLLAAGCHAMDALLLCMNQEVEEVFALGSRSDHPTYARYEYPASSSTLLRFKDGKVGKCASVIDCWQPYYFHTHLVGSEGSLLDNRFHSNLIEGLSRHHWNELSFKPVDSGDVADHPYQTQFDRFFEAIGKGEPMPLTGLDDAVRTHTVIFAAERSLKLGRPVKMTELEGV